MPLIDYPANFQYAVEQTLKAEVGPYANGGYSNHDWDPGGETKWGITKRSYPELDIKELTRDEAIDIYYQDFWIGSGCHRLDSRYVAAELFDTAVNTGQYRAQRLAQEAVNFLLADDILLVDGMVGPITAGKMNELSKRYELPLVVCMNLMQGMFYVRVCLANPALHREAAKGLMRRLLPPKELL